MSTGNTNNEFPWDESIRRYLAGEMSPEEMFALEKAALEDPFLADAIEGMSARTTAQLTADDKELKDRLSEKISLEKIRPAPIVSWTRIAIAAALLIPALIATILFINKTPENQDLAVNTTNQQKVENREMQSSVARDSSAVLIQNDSSASVGLLLQKSDTISSTNSFSPIVAQTNQPQVSESPVRKEKSRDIKDTVKAEYEKRTPEQLLVSAEKNDDAKVQSFDVKTASGTVAPPPGFIRSGAADANASGQLFYFTGQVTDVNQQPVTFANISIKNSNTLTYTDAKGYFRLMAADSILNIDVKSVGFLTNSTQLSYKQPQHLLVLNVASGQKKAKFSSKNKINEPIKEENDEDSLAVEDTTLVSTEPAAEPIDGWGAYHIYLLNNVRLQKAADNQFAYGSVVVTFLVNNNGWLSDFRIEKSLNTASDKEAIRLVKEGPKWELQNTNKAIRAKLTVHF